MNLPHISKSSKEKQYSSSMPVKRLTIDTRLYIEALLA
jgi:hypothetical protein